MEKLIMKSALPRTIILAAVLASGATTAAALQADPYHPSITVAQATPEDAGEQPQSGTMPPGMMGQGMMGGMMQPGMMGQGMMGGMMQPGMMSAMPMMRMHGHMMKIMFAVADANGDGGLSFEEVTTIHKRIFDKVDANKDGKVTPEEVQSFMRE